MIRAYKTSDIKDMIRIWNKVIEEGIAFPQEEFLNEESAIKFFSGQTYCGVFVMLAMRLILLVEENISVISL